MSVTPTTQQIAAALRLRVLQLRPEDIGLSDLNDCPSVWGAMIETSHPDATASLVILSDGSVSLYVSNGNGCVGCGNNDEVRRAAADLLHRAENALPLTTRTEDLSLPPKGLVRCYLLTSSGLRSAQVKLEEINRVDRSLSELYFAAQRVISSIERAGAGQSLAHELKKALAEISNDGAPTSPSTWPFCVRDAARVLDFKSPLAHLSLVDSPLPTSPPPNSPGSSQCLSVGNAVRRLRN